MVTNNIRMVLCDLDDTLLGAGGAPTERTVAAFRRCRELGILTGFVTARVQIGTEEVAKMYQPDIQILSAGAHGIYRGETLFYQGFGTEKTNALLRRMKELGAEGILAGCGREVFWQSDRIASSRNLKKATFHDFSRPIDADASVAYFGLEPEKVALLQAEFPGCTFLRYRGGRNGVMPEGVSKLSGIRRVCQMLDIPIEQVAAFGDDAGDMEMLRGCGLGVAMGNALPEVKRSADAVTVSNEDDGVAVFLEEHIFSQMGGNP